SRPRPSPSRWPTRCRRRINGSCSGPWSRPDARAIGSVTHEEVTLAGVRRPERCGGAAPLHAPYPGRRAGGGGRAAARGRVAGLAYGSMGVPAAVAAATFARLESLTGPNVRSVVAWDGDDPVSAAMVIVSDGVGGVNYVGTVPEARGRGLGELTTRWATNAA